MRRDSGQTLLELVGALAIAALVVTSIVWIATISIRNATFARNQSEATRLSQEVLEWARSERNADWEDFSDKSPGTYCLVKLSWSSPGTCSGSDKVSGIFTRELELQTISADEAEVVVRVSWTDSRGTHEVRLDTRLTRWR